MSLCLNPNCSSANPDGKASELFEKEAIQLEKLGKHPQIPELFAYLNHDDDRQYLVQEYIEGQNLEQELKSQGVFNEAKIKALLTDILPVLDFIHSQGVVHRDIKRLFGTWYGSIWGHKSTESLSGKRFN